ncbi:hypothetical protein ACH5RR_003346 [Cinchona calisaya]|uniref:Uncharacterized protein n=1 Tax=Cinchona calisaya TaxID=153742 RepID=A0ABD3AUL9_9GENT
MYQLYRSCTLAGTKSKSMLQFLGQNWMQKLSLWTKVLALGKDAPVKKFKMKLQLTIILVDIPQQSQLDEMSEETPLIQRSRHLKKKLPVMSDQFQLETVTATNVGNKSRVTSLNEMLPTNLRTCAKYGKSIYQCP